MPDLTRKQAIRHINRTFREQDESHRWPIGGRFNVTERAIRRVRNLQRQGLEIENADSYRELLETLISLVVNSPRVREYEYRINWRELNA